LDVTVVGRTGSSFGCVDVDDDGMRELASESYELDADILDGPSMGAVARRIGRSERHTRRLIRELTHRLGVDHPRAAVALAGHNGWVHIARNT